MKRQMFGAMAVVLPLIVGSAYADTVRTIVENTYWESDSNYNRMYTNGGGWSADSEWTILDGAWGYKEYIWMNIGTSWIGSIPAGEKIVSASLTFPAACRNNGVNAADASIFEVIGDDRGQAAMGTTVGTSASYYQNHTHYGLVTADQFPAVPADDPDYVGEANPVTFDITALLQGWANETLTTNPGQMMIVGSANFFRDDFGINAWPGHTDNPENGPVITIMTAPVPEPSMLVLLSASLLGLLAYAWRRRR